jgi:cytochrome c oxidase assembly protein subunit 15
MLKDRNWIVAWLVTGAFMVAGMVIIGGITRLTHSGLSMTDWKLIMGMIPPMNEMEWNKAFEQYKQFPEFQRVNSHYTVEDFKSIFFWEWFHRFLGRIIGMVFIFPNSKKLQSEIDYPKFHPSWPWRSPRILRLVHG